MIVKSYEQKNEKKPLKILIYGQTGIGKTTFACSGENSLLIDFDNGGYRLHPLDRVDKIEITKWEQVEQLLTSDLKEYDKIVIDTVGKALDCLTADIIKKNLKASYNGTLTLQGYGILKTRFVLFLNEILCMNKHIILVAHDLERSVSDNIEIRPDIVGGSLNIVAREMDLIGYYRSVEKKRSITFNHGANFFGKNSANLPNEIHIDNYREKKTITIDWIIDAVNKNEMLYVDILNKYNHKLADLTARVSDIKNIDDCKAFSVLFAKEEKIFDLRHKIAFNFNEKLKALNIKYNSGTKQFENIATVKDPETKDNQKGDLL